MKSMHAVAVAALFATAVSYNHKMLKILSPGLQRDAMTLSITTLSVMTDNILRLNATLHKQHSV